MHPVEYTHTRPYPRVLARKKASELLPFKDGDDGTDQSRPHGPESTARTPLTDISSGYVKILSPESCMHPDPEPLDTCSCYQDGFSWLDVKALKFLSVRSTF